VQVQDGAHSDFEDEKAVKSLTRDPEIFANELDENHVVSDQNEKGTEANEAEQFFQMIPLAGLLARSLRKSDLAGLEGLTDEEVLTGLQAFNESVRRVVGERLRKLKGQLANLRAVDQASGNSKFGGQLEGGTVDDFHHGLADRLGEQVD
jgi:hypothetical protein